MNCDFVAGKSVSTGKKGTVRAFPRDKEADVENRNNELYDENVLILSQVTTVSPLTQKISFLCSNRENLK